MQLTAVLTPADEGGFVAHNPETGTTTQGETVEEALANLKEARALYLTEFQGQPRATRWSRFSPFQRRRMLTVSPDSGQSASGVGVARIVKRYLKITLNSRTLSKASLETIA